MSVLIEPDCRHLALAILVPFSSWIEPLGFAAKRDSCTRGPALIRCTGTLGMGRFCTAGRQVSQHPESRPGFCDDFMVPSLPVGEVATLPMGHENPDS